jgi:FtsZ-interacting cell division protein YlmF
MLHSVAYDEPEVMKFQVREFTELKMPSDAFLDGAVIVVSFIDDNHLHRRGLDFLSGLAFATEAHMEKLDSGVYQLTPAD